MLLSRGEYFAGETISRESFFLIRPNTKYGQAVRGNSRCIPWIYYINT